MARYSLRRRSHSPRTLRATGVGVAAELVASAAMTAETQRQVAERHGSAISIPLAALALHTDWGRDPFGAA